MTNTDALLSYTALDGSPARGVVWSPGPLRHTVWVLAESGSAEARVVRVPVKAGETYREVGWDFDAFVTSRHGSYALNPMYRPACVQTARVVMSHAPQLPPKLWRAALDAGEQLALVA